MYKVLYDGWLCVSVSTRAGGIACTECQSVYQQHRTCNYPWRSTSIVTYKHESACIFNINLTEVHAQHTRLLVCWHYKIKAKTNYKWRWCVHLSICKCGLHLLYSVQSINEQLFNFNPHLNSKSMCLWLGMAWLHLSIHYSKYWCTRMFNISKLRYCRRQFEDHRNLVVW